MREMELAKGWRISVVRKCLETRHGQQDIVDFISARYTERFFRPIQDLNSRVEDDYGYGFAVMALCCLLIETLQCYYSGLPSTFPGDYDRIEKAKKQNRLSIEDRYAIPEQEQPRRGEGHKPFEIFFDNHRQLFPRMKGNEFYYNFRNGLLHQAQTFDGWRIRKSELLWDEKEKVVNRTLFADKLKQGFDQFLSKLACTPWDDDMWVKARRKIWWLAKLSEMDLHDLG